MSEQEGTSSINLGLASSLVSRFDLVLILRDERDNEWETQVANHILFGTGPIRHENTYDVNKLQAHFAAARDIDPVVSEGASRILKAYYLACRADEQRNAGRTTLRLNDSLYRLAKAHAKLVFRCEVTEIDAVLIVMLMESSFGFGRILEPINIIRKDIPLGPSDDQVEEVMDKLHLGTRSTQAGSANNVRSEDSVTSLNANQPMNPTQSNQEFDFNKYAFRKRQVNLINATTQDENNLPTESVENNCSSNERTSETVLPLQENHRYNRAVSQTLYQSQNSQGNPSTSYRRRVQINFDDEELDRLFSLDDPVPPVPDASSSQTNDMDNGTQVQRTHSSSNLEPESDHEQSQAKRKRIFHKCTDEDLACFDDMNF